MLNCLKTHRESLSVGNKKAISSKMPEVIELDAKVIELMGPSEGK